jgi:UDP-glucose 4-epimerase
MTVWVTGGNGFIGRNLIRLLADQGRAVHGIGHGLIDDAECVRLGLRNWINGEIEATNLDILAKRSGSPTAIFHLAGGSSVGLSIAQPLEDFSRTVVGTARLLEWLRRSAPNCRLVVASSAAVYGAHHDGPISEDAETLPVSPYGHHKLMMEELCRSFAVSYGLRSTVVRLFSVYGRGLRKQLLWDIGMRLGRGERTLTLGGTGAELRDWVHVRDAARLLATTADQPQRDAFYVMNGGGSAGTTVADVAGMLVTSWSGHGDIAIRFSGDVRSGDPFSLVADAARLRALPFSFETSLGDGIADTVAWLKDQPA